MSKWTHNICLPCWEERNPDVVPVRMKIEIIEPVMCCYCGHENVDGIYIREKPEGLLCKGVLGTHVQA